VSRLGGRWLAEEVKKSRVLYIEPDLRSDTPQIASLEEPMLLIRR
jgi:hypothetical protein